MNRGRDSKVGDKVTCRHKVHNLQIVYVLLSPINLFFLSFRLLSLTLCSPITLFFLLFRLLFPTLCSPIILFFLLFRLLFPHTSFTRQSVLSFCLVLLLLHSFDQKKCQEPQGFWHFVINAVGIIIAWI